MIIHLDTSGTVHFSTPYAQKHGLKTFYRWADLSPFVQGYVEAMTNAQACISAGVRPLFAFSDLASETLARIMEDCAKAQHPDWSYSTADGTWFWTDRQTRKWATMPPLTPYLGDDGRVYLLDAA